MPTAVNDTYSAPSGATVYGGTAAQVPSWVPLPGAMARFTVGGGVLQNNFRDVTANYFAAYYDAGIVNDYSGPGYAPDIGNYGAILFYGGGHSATNNGQVLALTPAASGLTFSSLSVPTAWTGSTATDSTNQVNNSYTTNITSQCDTNWGDAYPYDGSYRPPGIHSYSSNVVIPAANGGATYGTLFSAMVAAGGTSNMTTLGGSHELAIASVTTPASNVWSRVGASYFGAGTGYQGPLMAAYVPAQDRVYYSIGNSGTNVRWYDRAAGTHNVGASSGMVSGTDYNTGQLIHIPSRSLLLHVERNIGYVRIRYMSVGVADTNPSLGGTATLGTALPVDPFATGKTSHWAAAAWCPDNNRLIIGKVLTAPGDIDAGGAFDQAAVYEIEIPATLTDSWPVTRRVLTGVTDAQWDRTTWQQPVYMPKIKCWVFLQKVQGPAGGPDSILFYRPIGT